MHQALPLYILAGGQSRRFGTDKARALLHGRTLIQRVAEQLLPTTEETWVVADRPSKYSDLNLATIADPTPNRGPLNGLVTALSHQVRENGPGWIVLAPCDLVAPSPQLIQPLLDAINISPADFGAAYRNPGGRWEPLPCVIHSRALQAANQAIADESLSLWRFLESIDAISVLLGEVNNGILSANTRDELSRFDHFSSTDATNSPEALIRNIDDDDDLYASNICH